MVQISILVCIEGLVVSCRKCFTLGYYRYHNGYDKGILVHGTEVENLAFDIYSWFKIAPSKPEDFMQVAAELEDKEIFQVF